MLGGVAKELFDTYSNHPKTSDKMADAIIDKFIGSDSFAEAKENCRLVEQLTIWKPDYKCRTVPLRPPAHPSHCR